MVPEKFSTFSSWWLAAFPELHSVEALARRIAAPTGGGRPRLSHLPDRSI